MLNKCWVRILFFQTLFGTRTFWSSKAAGAIPQDQVWQQVVRVMSKAETNATPTEYDPTTW